MQKIAICDVNEKDRAKIKKYCSTYSMQHDLEWQIQEFTSGESLIEVDFPDILFLEVNLKTLSGLLVKEILERKHADTRILFVSNEEKCMKQAFGKNVFGFLKKPVLYQEFEQASSRIMEDIIQSHNYVFCKNHGKIEKVYFCDMKYIESYGRYTKIHVRKDGDYRLSDKCIGDWCEEMKLHNFASCHRCFLVNLFFVKQVGKSVELVEGTSIPISKSKRADFYKNFREFIWRKNNGENDERVLQKSGEEYV